MEMRDFANTVRRNDFRMWDPRSIRDLRAWQVTGVEREMGKQPVDIVECGE